MVERIRIRTRIHQAEFAVYDANTWAQSAPKPRRIELERNAQQAVDAVMAKTASASGHP